MKAFKVFVFGVLYGWILKLAIDRIYRENEMEDLRNENASLQEYIRTLESKLQAWSSGSKPVAPPVREPDPVRAEPVPAKRDKDDLQVIRGIGPAIEKKLNNAGILTYEALASLGTQELETILGNTRRLVQEGDLIKQAKKLAGQK